MKGKKLDENGGKQPNPHNPYNPHNPQRSSPPRNTRTPADTIDCARVTGWMLQNPQDAGRGQKEPKSAPPRPVPSPNDVYGDEGIQVIENQYRQNLQKIEDLMELIQRSDAQAYEIEMSLIVEREREQRKSSAKAQIIANLQQSVDQILPSTALMPTTIS